MARKFLQMGYTRASQSSNRPRGRKYDKSSGKELVSDSLHHMKSESAQIFYRKWKEAEGNLTYKILKLKWKEEYG